MDSQAKITISISASPAPALRPAQSIFFGQVLSIRFFAIGFPSALNSVRVADRWAAPICSVRPRPPPMTPARRSVNALGDRTLFRQSLKDAEATVLEGDENLGGVAVDVGSAGRAGGARCDHTTTPGASSAYTAAR
jgi:hypothetical protein